LQEEARAMSYVLGNATDSLATAGIKGAVPGETPFEVTSANIQIAAQVATNPSGTFSSPLPEGNGGGESPVFELPSGSNLTGAEEDVEVVAITNQQSPFEGIRIGDPYGLQQNMQGAVATFELREPGGALKNVSLDPMVQTPIQFRIPLTISARQEARPSVSVSANLMYSQRLNRFIASTVLLCSVNGNNDENYSITRNLCISSIPC
jgi:hypothetical protein